MLKKDIKVGGYYTAKVSDKIVTVRVDAIRTAASRGPDRVGDYYDVTNLATGRKTTFRSAAKFRSVAADPTVARQTAPTDVVPVTATVRHLPEGADVEAETGLPARQAVYGFRGPTGGQHTAPPTTDCPPVPNPLPSFGIAAQLAAKAARPVDDSPHLIVEARAGTGKTTTAVEGIKEFKGVPSKIAPSPQQRAVWDAIAKSKGKAVSVAFVAFNRSIAAELKARVPAGCDAMTMHGLGNRAVRKAFKMWGGQGGMAEFRTSDIIIELLGGGDHRELRRKHGPLMKLVGELVSLCKMNLLDGTPEELSALISHYDLDTEGVVRADVYGLVPRVLDRCKDVAKDGCMDFDDMIWLPVVLDLPMDPYDILVGDEVQDWNRCQQALAKKAGRRLILIGDPKQAIYGFAGADAKSMDRMFEELEATPRGVEKLYLTVTRRCGKAIVEEARKIVPDFDAHEGNGTGRIGRAIFNEKDVTADTASGYQSLTADGDMVLCRVNAPLVSECFRFIKAGRKANIQGRDVGKGLIKLVEKLCRPLDPGAVSIPTLVERLGAWLDGEQKVEAAKKNPSETKMINLQDKHDCLLCFADGGAETARGVIDRIEAVFTDDKTKPGIRLSSIHKAKGLESRRVFLLEPEGATVPHPMAKTPWQVEQEWNLRYVAVTRAIEELVYVS